MLKLFEVSKDCAQDIELALSEACTNVISHATTDDKYDVQVRVDDQQCVTSVHNAGNGFDDEKLRERCAIRMRRQDVAWRSCTP